MHQFRNSNPPGPRDHGGNLEAAMRDHGGTREEWVDLSTGINPEPYPIPALPSMLWTALPDQDLTRRVIESARRFWNVPERAQIVPAPGASALIARIPMLSTPGRVQITSPTYNEHAAAFAAAGWTFGDSGCASARVLVHPNNPDGRLFEAKDINKGLTVIDESFCDIAPQHSLIAQTNQPGVIVLKSFGKFWGLAGLRLGFAICTAETARHLSNLLGPWPVSGPALHIGALALDDHRWAVTTRTRLAEDRLRLDRMMHEAGAEIAGGTDLFGLYRVSDAARWQAQLARNHVWSRIFPYARDLIRLGLPQKDRWMQLERAL